MNLRWSKEIRPLLWPWCVAVVGMTIPLFPATNPFRPDTGYSAVGYCLLICSVALMAAAPFGAEFQHGTWSLVLSQPVERVRIWREKLNTLALPLAALGLLCWRLAVFAREPSLLQIALGTNFLLASICGVLICVVRPGGVGRAWLCMASLPVVFAAVSVTLWSFSSGYVSTWVVDKIALIVWAGLVYLAALLYLGWGFWRQKRWAVYSGLAALALASCLSQEDTMGQFQTEQLEAPQILLMATFVLATACAGCFWAIGARSVIGGAVFNLTMQFCVLVVAMFWLQRAYGESIDPDDSRALLPLIVAELVYAVAFLWLGKRCFERLEWKQWVPGEGLSLKRAGPRFLGWFTLLRCRPHGALLNLVRKELRLQKPVFTLAALFCFCWCAALALLLGQQPDTCAAAFGFLASIYVPLAVILAGCVSLGEEKSLGLTGWQLALPVSWLRQWLVKLGVSAAVCFLLALLLPGALVALTPAQAKVASGDLPILGLILVGGVTFAVSFWAATLYRNTITTVLSTFAALVVLYACASLGSWLGTQGIGIRLLQLLVTHFDFGALPAPNLNGFGLHLAVTVPAVIAAALIQSAFQFRREQVAKRILWKYPAILAAVVFLVAYSCTLGPE